MLFARASHLSGNTAFFLHCCTYCVPLSKALELKLLQRRLTTGGCGLTRKHPAWHVCNFISLKRGFAEEKHMWIYLLIKKISLSKDSLCLDVRWLNAYLSLCLHFNLERFIGIHHLLHSHSPSTCLLHFYFCSSLPTFPRDLFDNLQRKRWSWLLSPLGYMCRWTERESSSSRNTVRLFS